MPKIWRASIVEQIFKNKDSSSVTNYCPISLTCMCCKVMESVIHVQLMSYLREHNLISKAQHGFLSKRSTGTNLLSCLQDWQLSVKVNKLVDVIYLDFSKAFDSLVHSKILVKLSSYGIGFELLSWIQSFLTGRTQRVIVDNALSKPIYVAAVWSRVQSLVLSFLFCLSMILLTASQPTG